MIQPTTALLAAGTAVVTLGAIFPIPIFPENDLAHSVLTTTFIGLLVMVIFNEWFGWPLSGIIVPGYLAPVFFVQPLSAVVIIVEAIATYLIVRLFSDVLSRTRLWSRFFGRDRFFAFLLFGIAIRCVGEGFAFPRLGQWINDAFGGTFDYRNHFYSIGLVIVPLCANAFWKTGLSRGLLVGTCTVSITYASVRWLLIPFTNFSISHFEVFYGFHAASFLGNVKASIIVLTGAYLASRTNHLYGWDYNGILVPALLALAWFEPIRIAATVVEASIAVMATKALVNTRWLKTTTIEGGRRFLLVYLVSFAIKWCLGIATAAWWPTFPIRSIYGFGFLLTTLIAVKVMQKGTITIRPLLQTSLVAMIGGALATALLRVILPMGPAVPPIPPIDLRNPVVDVPGDVLNTLAFDRARMIREQAEKGYDRPLGPELERFSSAISSLVAAIDAGPATEAARPYLRLAVRNFRDLGFEIVRLTDSRTGRRYLYVRERARDPRHLRGWGLYLFPMEPRGELVLEVPRPVTEPIAMDVAIALTEALPVRALLIHGAEPGSRADGSADALRFPFSPFQTAHEVFADRDVVQVRASTSGRSEIYFEREIPEALDLDALRRLVGELDTFLAGQARFDAHNVQRVAARRTFTTLAASDAAAIQLVSRRVEGEPIVEVEDDLSVAAFILGSLFRETGTIARSGSEAYQPPSLADALFFDERILEPTIRLATEVAADGEIDEGRLAAIALSAAAAGYEVVRYRTAYSPESYLTLREAGPVEGRRHWGFVCIRTGPAAPFVVEVPAPVTEYHTVEAGARLFDFLNARAIIVATASRLANAAGTADVSHRANVLNMFQVAHQVCLRSAPPGEVWALQVKGFSQNDPFEEPDVVISTGRELRRREDVPEVLASLQRQLLQLGPEVVIYDGTMRTRRFHGGGSVQRDYAKTQAGGAFAYLWLSDEFRETFRSRPVDESVGDAFHSLEVERIRGNLGPWLSAYASRLASRPIDESVSFDEPLFAEVVRRLETYSELLNVVDLAHGQSLAADLGGRLVAFVDIPTRRRYVVLLPSERDARYVVIVNPHALERRRVEVNADEEDLPKVVDDFIRRNWGSMVIRRGSKD